MTNPYAPPQGPDQDVSQGALPGVFGGLSSSNRQIAQSNRSTGLKLALMFGTLLLAAFATLLAAGALALLLHGNKP